MSLQPAIDEVTGDTTHFSFNGDLELKYHQSKNMLDAIIFLIEYRIKLNVEPMVERKTIISSIKNTVASTLDLDQGSIPNFVYKDVSIGWGICYPIDEGYQSIKLINGSSANPFAKYSYVPSLSDDRENNSASSFPLHSDFRVSFTTQRAGFLFFNFNYVKGRQNHQSNPD